MKHLETGTLTYGSHKEYARQRSGVPEFAAIHDTLLEAKQQQGKLGKKEYSSDAEILEDIVRRLQALESKINETPGSSETATRRKRNFERASRSAALLQSAYETSLMRFQRRG